MRTIPEADNPDEKTIHFEYISRDSLAKNNFDFFRHNEEGINLIKLHGALDIFAHRDEINLAKLSTKNLSIDQYIEILTKLNENTNPYKNVKATNEIIYLDESREINFLRKTLLSGMHKFTDKNSQVAPFEFLRLFSGNINHCNILLSIGYSFGDYHINTVIRDWLSFSEERYLVIVDPSANIPNEFAHLYRQIYLDNKTFFEFISTLDNIALSFKDEFLMQLFKRRRDSLRKKISKRKW